MTFKSVVIGHSFVRRTRDFAFAGLEDTDPNCRLKDVTVEWHGHGGFSIHDLDKLVPHLITANFDFMVLDVGTNDLSSETVCPIQLARLMFGASHWILGTLPSLKHLFIVDILQRSTTSAYPCRRDFNEAVIIYNFELRNQITLHGGAISCVPLKGLSAYCDYLSSDGVHLSSKVPPGRAHSGVFHHYMLIRRSLIQGVKLATSQGGFFSPFFSTIICSFGGL